MYITKGSRGSISVGIPYPSRIAKLLGFTWHHWVSGWSRVIKCKQCDGVFSIPAWISVPLPSTVWDWITYSSGFNLTHVVKSIHRCFNTWRFVILFPGDITPSVLQGIMGRKWCKNIRIHSISIILQRALVFENANSIQLVMLQICPKHFMK